MAEEMTPGEVARRLEDVVREVRGVSDKMLLREVYDAQRNSMEQRLAAIENDRSAIRKLIYGVIAAFVVSTVGQIFITVLHN